MTKELIELVGNNIHFEKLGLCITSKLQLSNF